MFRLCSKYVSTELEVCFHGAQVMFWPSLEVCLTLIEVCFDRSRSWLRPCSILFQPCVRFFSTVVPGMFRPSLEVCFDRARVGFSTVLKVCFNRAWGLFQPCLRHISTVHKVCFDRARGMFKLTCGMFWPCTRYNSTVAQSVFLP